MFGIFFVLNNLNEFDLIRFVIGTGYEYDGNVAWVLQVRRAEVVTK
jgi:hypothetical protein